LEFQQQNRMFSVGLVNTIESFLILNASTLRHQLLSISSSSSSSASASLTKTPLLSNKSNLPLSTLRHQLLSISSSSSSSASASLTKSPLHSNKSNLPLFVCLGGIRWIFIRTEITPNPNSRKFIPQGVTVLEPTAGSSTTVLTRDFPTAMSSHSSPLARELFNIKGVKSVMLGNDFVTVVKETDDTPTTTTSTTTTATPTAAASAGLTWKQLIPQIESCLTEFFSSGKPVIDPEAQAPEDTKIQEEDSETVAMIKELIETRVRPSVQQDGGDIEYVGFQDGVVFLRMQGSCSGCPSSSATLQGGIERMLMHYCSEVQAVVAVDDDDLEKINFEQFQKFQTKS